MFCVHSFSISPLMARLKVTSQPTAYCWDMIRFQRGSRIDMLGQTGQFSSRPDGTRISRLRHGGPRRGARQSVRTVPTGRSVWGEEWLLNQAWHTLLASSRSAASGRVTRSHPLSLIHI